MSVETMADEHDRFDGSEFGASTFTESSFDSQAYGDMASLRVGDVTRLKSSRSTTSSILSGSNIRYGQANNISSRVLNTKPTISIDKTYDLSIPSGNQLEGMSSRNVDTRTRDTGDWVPDKINMVSNGGFSIEPPNGWVEKIPQNGTVTK